MCFYFGLPENSVKISQRYKKAFVDKQTFNPNLKYNGFEHPITPIICNDNVENIITASWGLLPEWTKEKSFRKNTLNARIETVEVLPSFKNYVQNRCIIPASFFYDWRHEGKLKIPYKIYNADAEIFSFAGIYSDWKDLSLNQTIRTYSILTTEANETMKFIHNVKQRMPIILKLEDEHNWLLGDDIQKYSHPYSVNLLGFTI
jgi:putative SOS response-associated peptidase YedK